MVLVGPGQRPIWHVKIKEIGLTSHIKKILLSISKFINIDRVQIYFRTKLRGIYFDFEIKRAWEDC